MSTHPSTSLQTGTSVFLGLIKLMRLKQWVKNGFVLAPLVFAGLFVVPLAVIQAMSAVLLFCLASSATYILNDINDIERDRAHPTKSKKRPLASGQVKVPQALVLLGILYLSLIAAYWFMPEVMMVIYAYMLLNVAYSFTLKHQPVIDIFTIATGFVLRVVAGAMALAVPVSHWMFVTTFCLALYLAAVKRRQELLSSGDSSRAVLKNYTVKLVDRYAEMSATGALLFYSLFVMNEKPQLVITIPLVLFGLFRYWYVVEKLDGGESPTDALMGDWPLLSTVVLWISACAWVVTGGGFNV